VQNFARLKITDPRFYSVVAGHWILFGFLAVGACAEQTEEEPKGFRLESAGARFGFSPTSRAHNFHMVEATVNWDLPWAWDLGARWRLQSRLDVAAGYLGDPGGNAAIGMVGASLLVGQQKSPLSFEAGVSPTLISETKFGTKDFGIPFEFTSHVGVNWDVTRRVRLGYQFQHMSNAGLGSTNPGINLHALGVGYLF
jgi:hypothetical protein